MTDAELTESLVAELGEDVGKACADYESCLQRINGEFRLMEKCLKEKKRLQRKVQDVKGILREESKESAKLETELKAQSDALSKLGKEYDSSFLSLLIGVKIRLWNDNDRLKFKEQYNRFKERSVIVFGVLPLFQSVAGFSHVIHQIHTLFLFYYYVSLSVRENILKMNGSRIEPWWIYHHYLTLMAALLFLLITPDHPCVVTGGVQFINYFMVWQAVVMSLQIRYQRNRHYARKALAKKTAMDVRTTEVIDERPHGDFRFLIPALYLTYVYQSLIAVYFVFVGIWGEFPSQSQVYRYHVWVLASLWLVLPVGNTYTLMQVLYKKRMVSSNRTLVALRRLRRMARRMLG